MIKVIYKNAEDGTTREEEYKDIKELYSHIEEEILTYESDSTVVIKRDKNVIYTHSFNRHHT